MNLDLLERRIAAERERWRIQTREHPNDAAAERRTAKAIGYTARCDDPFVSVRCSALAELVAVARAAALLAEQEALVEDLTVEERAALATIREAMA